MMEFFQIEVGKKMEKMEKRIEKITRKRDYFVLHKKIAQIFNNPIYLSLTLILLSLYNS